MSRLLRYYDATRFAHRILIGDSSDPERLAHNRRLIDEFRDRLNLVHQAYPGMSSCDALEQLSRLVTTPYSVFSGDDDLLCPRGMESCVAFLETHSEFTAAHGRGVMLLVEGGRPYGPVIGTKRYPQAVLNAETGSGRLREFFTSSLCSLFYSVHRTPVWQDMFRGISQLPGINNRNVFKDELIPTCVSVIRGKVKALETLSLIRQPHDGTTRFPHVVDWITDPIWFPSYQLFQQRLVKELIQQDGLTEQDAVAIVREGFWRCLAHEVFVCWRTDEATPVRHHPSRVREWAKRLPGLQRSWRAVQTTRLRLRMQRADADGLSLSRLLHASSPFHREFMPVYQAITSQPAGDPWR